MTRSATLSWCLAGGAVLALLLGVAALTGPVAVAPGDIAGLLAHKLLGVGQAPAPMVETVLWEVRLPRILAGLGIGAALAAAGSAYQGLFRNPLVSPDMLGVSAGASLGAVLGIFLSLPVAAIQGLAFAGGLLAVTLVYAIGGAARRGDPVLVLVLAGIAIGAVLGAALSLLKVLADPYSQLPTITYWLLGSLASVTRGDVLATLPAFLLGLVPLVLLRWRLNLLTLAEEEILALGLDARRQRLMLIGGATLLTAASVSISGNIGWIGLIVPHVARLLVGPDFSRLLPVSMLLGGGFLVAMDLLARSIATIEVPLGILTALVGAPFFLWLLLTARRGWG